MPSVSAHGVCVCTGDTADAAPRPGVERVMGVDGGRPRCKKCDRWVRCEKCEGETDMCEDCVIDNVCTCVQNGTYDVYYVYMCT